MKCSRCGKDAQYRGSFGYDRLCNGCYNKLDGGVKL